MLNGDHEDPRDHQVGEEGLYAVNFGGGQVDITLGKFVFSPPEAYLIENGKVDPPGQGRDDRRQRPGRVTRSA